MQTRDQKYAQDAYEHVIEIAKKKDEHFGRVYGSMAHKLPILIHVSGLAQALAFVFSRDKGNGLGQLLEDLSQTVCGSKSATATDLLKRSRGDDPQSNLRDYLYLTEQTLAALLWYKRYAQSILKVEQGDEVNEDKPEEESQA